MKVKKITYKSGKVVYKSHYRRRWKDYFPLPCNFEQSIIWLALLPIWFVTTTFEYLIGNWHKFDNAKSAIRFSRLMQVEKRKVVNQRKIEKLNKKSKIDDSTVVKVERIL